ncbi:MAG TPA: aminodeoxychorismate/anthranilate synthase component II [Candidatus Acidoferrales bacterium]|nr:aminodeoxychorismate/anthranilate synthase component II [Candidatus Acidoferrales bacterium]
MLLVIDNYDSFTYNLVQYLGELGAEPQVVRNDAITVNEIARRNYCGIVISPGPGEPRGAGVSLQVIRELAGKLPILGVCLGHQAIGEAFGGRVVRAPKPIHGKSCVIHHDGTGVFAGLPSDVEIGRYHSLVIERETCPTDLVITAQTADGIIMGVRHKEYAVEGVQFHPESVLTPSGMAMLRNFCDRCAAETIHKT